MTLGFAAAHGGGQHLANKVVHVEGLAVLLELELGVDHVGDAAMAEHHGGLLEHDGLRAQLAGGQRREGARLARADDAQIHVDGLVDLALRHLLRRNLKAVLAFLVHLVLGEQAGLVREGDAGQGRHGCRGSARERALEKASPADTHGGFLLYRLFTESCGIPARQPAERGNE